MSCPNDQDVKSGSGAAPVRRAVIDDGFAARIRALAEKYGGVSHIARLCGFSEGVVRSWRDGRSDPSRRRCVALAHGLDISLPWLMTGSGLMLDESGKRKHGNVVLPAIDVRRLSAAMRVLQSTLESTGNHLPVESRAELLSEYYAVLGDPDPVTRAEGIGTVHQHLLQRIRQEGTSKKVIETSGKRIRNKGPDSGMPPRIA